MVRDLHHMIADPRRINTRAFAIISCFQYLISVGANFQDGIYKNSATNYSQANFRSNVDGRISKNINLSFDISGRQENRNYPTRTSSSIFSMLMRGKPNLPAYTGLMA